MLAGKMASDRHLCEWVDSDDSRFIPSNPMESGYTAATPILLA